MVTAEGSGVLGEERFIAVCVLQFAAGLEVAMRTFVRFTLVLVALLSALPAVAGKIGFLDAERAVASVGQGKAKIQELEEWAAPRRARLEQMQANAVQLRDQLAAQRNVATPEAVQKLESDLLQARRELEDGSRNFNRDVDAKQNELLGEVALKIGTVASDYGKANDYDAIFMLKAQPLAYYSEESDITDIVIRLYDERFPPD
jgi:Skp family chaperone for outer membrane proteins